MDFKAILLLFASVLLVSTEVSSNHGPHDQELNMKDRSERHGLFSVWIYPRIPKWNPVFRAPPSPPPMNEEAPTRVPVAMPLTTSTAAQPPPLSTPQVKTNGDCVPLCDKRCKIETNKKICRRSCMACCDRCKCVPPGDYGSNLDKCGKCYTDMNYHGHKCP
ncbi:hypothetical protein Pyn_25270 [Prunus yedoensis var. nudiflora]|uniref:Gibberellin-regulated protein 14 n=1 Tax=Prunus yedoensis var. nudiflora TaxID=2094558 RepID=A0A314XYE1_PRUYE|nr:hypothetical protein Pyn_25270 [Prunus yedoensis var. nudiflora]